MARYIEFTDADDGKVLVEVEQEEVSPPAGVEKAGLLSRRKPSEAVADAAATFDDAVKRAVRSNVLAVSNAVTSLPKAPTEVELVFGLKATGELGNIAIARVGTEANLSIKLTWKVVESEGP
jgi:Trypsin-co-occurring domain 1